MACPLRIEFEGACYLRHAPINGQPDRAPRDEGKTAAQGGALTMEEWAAKVQRGEA